MWGTLREGAGARGGSAPAGPLISEDPELYLEGDGSLGRFQAEVWATGSSAREVL